MSLEEFRKIQLSGAGGESGKYPAPARCIFRTVLKTFPWKSKMKPVVKYGAYQDILLRVPIYDIVTKCYFLMNTL